MTSATSFILHGGFRPGEKKDDPFFESIFKRFSSKTNVLLVMHAKEEAKRERNAEETKQEMLKNAPTLKLEFAVAEKENLKEQLTWANVVYFHGGNSKIILEELSFPFDWKKCLAGKLVVADSAGGVFLSSYGYSLLSRKFYEGLGLLPIVFIPHYRQDLDYVPPKTDLEVVKLPEFEFGEFVLDL